MGDIAEITIGMNNSKFTKLDENGELQIIKLSDVQNNILQKNTIENYRLIDKSIQTIRKYKVEQTDILISCKGPAIKICMVLKIEDNIYLLTFLV